MILLVRGEGEPSWGLCKESSRKFQENYVKGGTFEAAKLKGSIANKLTCKC